MLAQVVILLTHIRILGRTHTILTKGLVIIPNPSRQILGKYYKLGEECFLPDPYQFIIHYIVMPFNNIACNLRN
jgi:hypothetical protein